MASLTNKNKFDTPFMYYPYMTEMESVAYTRERFKLHRYLGHAKSALMNGNRYRVDFWRRLYKWDEDAITWLVVAEFAPNEKVSWED